MFLVNSLDPILILISSESSFHFFAAKYLHDLDNLDGCMTGYHVPADEETKSDKKRWRPTLQTFLTA